MAVQGLVRLRRHQIGRQISFGDVATPAHVFPFKGVPSIDRLWTDPDIDVGSIDPVAAPYTGPGDFTADYTDPSLRYNTVPLLMCAFFGGHVSPTGGGDAQTWTHHPESTSVDERDLFTEEFGDDVLTDYYQLRDGILESFEVHGSEGLGALDTTMTWRYGDWASTGSTDFPVVGTVPTPDLEVDPNEAIVYLKDMGIYIADTVAGLGAGQVLDALHEMTIRFNQEVDLKRYANGDQSFAIDAYGSGARGIEFEFVFAKTDDTVGTGSESDAWMSEEAVNRYVQLVFVSKVLAQTPSTFYGWTITAPIRYYTREEGDLNNNSTVVLTGHAFFDPEDFDGVFESVLVNTLTEADLGETPS